MTPRKTLATTLAAALTVLLFAACEPTPPPAAPPKPKPAPQSPPTTAKPKPKPTTATTAPPKPTTTAPPTTTTPTTATPAPSPSGFVHPGVLVDRAQLDMVKAKIAAGAEPWSSALDRALSTASSVKTQARPASHRYSSLSYDPNPVRVLQAASASNTDWMDSHPQYGYRNIGDVEHLDDARAAYTHALIWYYTGNQAHANKAIEIMNAWSGTLVEIKFDQPRRPDNDAPLYNNGKLEAGWGGSLFARAAEIIRYSGAGWSGSDIARFENLLHDVYLPLTITGWSNGANWLMTFAEATISIGVFTNDRDAFNAGITYWRQKTPTTIYMTSDGPRPLPPHPAYDTDAEIRALWHNPDRYIQGLQGETLRDLSHMTMGLGAMANAAETARIQGVNLYGEQQNRILTGFELAAGYVNDYLDTGTTPPGWVGDPVDAGGTYFQRGWDIAYNHYARRAGIAMPETKRLVERTRNQDTAALHMSWETLTHTR